MDAQRDDPGTSTSPEVVSALAEFARLAQQILVASTPETVHAGATTLLLRLLYLCELHHGALLLATSSHSALKPSFWRSLSERKMLRILAREGIDEQELFALLATCSGDEEIGVLSSNPGWVICQHLLPHPSSLPLDTHVPAELLGAPLSSTQSFFVIGGLQTTGTPSHQAAIEHMQKVWPLVADAVGMVIVSLLQAEKMFDLEMATHQRDLQQMEWLKAELLATVSHELRSPLASIQGYAATLLRHERRMAREERHEFLLAIHDAGQRLSVIIDRLLEMSQLETETISLNRVPVNPVYLAREAITAREQLLQGTDTSSSAPEMQEHAALPRWTFALSIEDRHGNRIDEFPVIEADRRLLREVLDQLLENAVLYSPEGGEIAVGLRTRGSEQVYQISQALAQPSVAQRSTVSFPQSWSRYQPMVEIWVQDHGMGIEGAHLEQIFQRFYRVDTSLTRVVGGLGIGLTMCKQIVELHGGILWVESEVGKGSTFHVLLPLNGQMHVSAHIRNMSK